MSEPSTRIRLVVLYGGQSAEHDVSRVSAASLLRAIDTDRYDIEPVAIGRDGTWRRSEEVVAAIGSGSALPDSLPADGIEAAPGAALAAPDPTQSVVVFPLLHGPRGEDGTVQGLLELADVPYVGCGVLGSALNMDKAMAKVVATQAGIPQVRHRAVRDCDVDDSFLESAIDDLGLPLFVKPANMGSSVGVTRADDLTSLRSAVGAAAAFDEWIVIEEAVTAREVEVGVLGFQDPRASVVGEIVPTHDFYDYDDKYVDGAARMVIPAEVPDDVAEQARDLALRAFRLLRCDGLARVDFFYEEGGRGLLFNEINTLPGFTPFSTLR